MELIREHKDSCVEATARKHYRDNSVLPVVISVF